MATTTSPTIAAEAESRILAALKETSTNLDRFVDELIDRSDRLHRVDAADLNDLVGDVRIGIRCIEIVTDADNARSEVA